MEPDGKYQSRFLDAGETHQLLVAAGVPTAAQRLCASASEAVRAAEEVGYPVALKLVGPELVHKSDVDGVLLDLASPAEVRRAYRRLTKLAGHLGLGSWSVLVQEMAARGDAEVFVGVKRDPTFGPVVLVGAGGRLVELLDDLAIRRCPIAPKTARALLAATRVGSALDGYRGGARRLAGLAEAISAVSRVPLVHRDVQEVDVNPLALGADGRWRAFDARVLVSAEPAAAPPPRRPPDEAVRLVGSILDARSVVVVGASASDPRKPGARVLAYLLRYGYAGAVYVVHPTAAEITGQRCYPAIEALPDVPLDLACIAVPAPACVDVLERCGRKGVRAAVVLTAGFGEAGDEVGEEALGLVADRYGMGLSGPNTVGVISPRGRLHACFSQAQEVVRPLAGGVALVTQSGALGGSLLSQAWERGLGVSRFVSVGNQVRLSFSDYLHYLAGDPETRVACLLLEGLVDGPAFVDALERMREAGKPVVALKAGRSAVGGAAVRSHTGALAGDGRVYDAVLTEAGAVSVATLTELLDVALALERQPLPRGRHVGVASTSGGACSLVADLCAAAGLDLPELPPRERRLLAAVLPPFAAMRNPVDVTAHVVADTSLLGRALRVMLASECLDALLVVLTTVADPQAREIADDLAASAREAGKPVVVAWTIARSLAEDGISALERQGVPVFPALERAVAALDGLTRAARP